MCNFNASTIHSWFVCCYFVSVTYKHNQNENYAISFYVISHLVGLYDFVGVFFCLARLPDVRVKVSEGERRKKTTKNLIRKCHLLSLAKLSHASHLKKSTHTQKTHSLRVYLTISYTLILIHQSKYVCHFKWKDIIIFMFSHTFFCLIFSFVTVDQMIKIR